MNLLSDGELRSGKSAGALNYATEAENCIFIKPARENKFSAG